MVVSGTAETKQIRLRNELLLTPEPPAARALAPQTIEPEASGLFLLQFKTAPLTNQVTALRALGVECLRYVPDDAYIVRLRRAQPGSVSRLPFIQWLGEYQPGHKIHQTLNPLLASGEPAEVRLLLAPGPTAAEAQPAGKALASVTQFTRLSSGSVVHARVRPGGLAVLANSPAVLWIEPDTHPRLYDEVASRIVDGAPANGEKYHTLMEELGFTGKGVVVDVADSGLNNGDKETMHPDLAGRVDAFFYYGKLESAADEHSHGTHVTGIVAGNGATGETDENGYLFGFGVAPEAHVVAQRIFDGAGGYEAPPSNERLTRDAVRAGAVIGSNSWGDDTQGRYDLNAAEFDGLVRDADAETPGDQPYIIEFSAGNAGPGAQTIGSPAVGKNVIATGASENDRLDLYIYADGIDAMADFSSRGPCEDGRIKPDIVAPGTWIASLQSASATDENAWMSISPNYQYQGGTSQAGPHASGAAAVFVQYYRETHAGLTPSPALVKAALINSADDMDDASGGTDPIPNMDEGWGRLNLANLIGTNRRTEFIEQSSELAQGEVLEQRVVVGNPDEPFKVTLVYTDVPGLPAAIPALVNDLDLEVVGPDGTLYRGNQFLAGESIRNPEAADRLNNVEGVHLWVPEPGEYTVRVRAVRVAEDIHHRVNLSPRQDFALVFSGDLPLPGVGTMLMDQAAYRAPGTIQLRLIDFDLGGQPSVSVRVRSATETNAELIALLPQGRFGVFTGAVAIVTGPAGADGQLQVAEGDLIEALYEDAAPAGTRIAEAVADFTPPQITAVSAVEKLGKVRVSWATDESANSWVAYGTTTSLGLTATNRLFETGHEISLAGLEPGATYYLMVGSTDEAGNVTTDNRGGQFYTVTMPTVPTVLIVDAFQDPFGILEIPVSTYTEALDAAGISYAVWDVAQEGTTPEASDLEPFRVVMWRVPELTASLTAADTKAIRDYVKNGGGFFMASMEVLSRLDESGLGSFRTDVLQVDSFDVDPGVASIAGLDNQSLTAGIDTLLDYSAYPDLIIIQPDISDTFKTSTNAAPILFDQDTGKAVALRFPRTGRDDVGRLIFCSFPIDTVPLEGESPNNRVELLRNFVAFLAPDAVTLPTLDLDRAEYTIPAQAVIELTAPGLAAGGSVSATLSSDRHTNGVAVVLAPAVRSGLFRGLATLVAETNNPAAGEFPVQDGDRIKVEFRQATPETTLAVFATIDTTPPAIDAVSAEPDYSDAVVRWSTTDLCDSLVQFGESPLLGRTAYSDLLTTDHEVILTGLLPDRDYYFQVVSRDAAGNTATDNRQGVFYVLRTLKPLSPPFVDSLESNPTNWTVLNEELDMETGLLLQSSAWAWGEPANELAAGGPTGPHMWATNLGNDGNDYANSSLITPALDLSGGNRATLHFWHNYDFTPRPEETSILEAGGVFVTTNNGALWIPFPEAQYGESSLGWEAVELDLTPYLGNVIRIGWAYQLFSLDSVAHPGWVVDDISITVTNLERGTIIVSNNLAAAAFQLAGPLSQTGQGWSTTILDAPPGVYIVQYQPVPYYNTPPPQTNALSGANTLVFRGDYAFPDTNQNGISDLYEVEVFKSVDPNRRADTDTDLDGFCDFAEFQAGTDPLRPDSLLQVGEPAVTANRTVVVPWTAVAGRAYRLQMSTDLVTWQAASEWFVPSTTNASVTLPPLTGREAYSFRLEVRP